MTYWRQQIYYKYLILLFLLLSGASAPAQPAQPAQKIPFRISVENTSSHVQAQAVREFSQLISERLGSRVRVEFYDSARLFRDSEVIGAIARGNLEMAVPGTWQVSNTVPELAYFLLPEFFGARSGPDSSFFLTPAGTELLQRMERAMQVVIPGDWLDLGPAHIFTTGAVVRSPFDLSGLRIRVAGGEANRLRVETFGATGIAIPFPDLMTALDRGMVDGVLTTFETIRSARLWERGISYAYLDYQYFPQYVPVVSRAFWSRLTPGEHEIFRNTWNAVAARQRIAAARAQLSARLEAQRNGVVIFEPSAATQATSKALLAEHRAEIIAALGVDEAFIRRLAVSGAQRE